MIHTTPFCKRTAVPWRAGGCRSAGLPQAGPARSPVRPYQRASARARGLAGSAGPRPDKITQFVAREIEVTLQVMHRVVQAPACPFAARVNRLGAKCGQLLGGKLALLFKGAQQGLEVRPFGREGGGLLLEPCDLSAEFLKRVRRAFPIRGRVIREVR